MLNVLWFPGDQMACGVYRCFAPAMSLSDMGVANSEMITHHDAAAFGKVQENVLDWADIVVFQRPGHPIFIEWFRACEKYHVPFLLEFDDDLWHIARHNPSYDHWQRDETKRVLNDGLASCAHIIVSTPELKQRVLEASGRRWSDVTVAYNFLHHDLWSDNALSPVRRQIDPFGRIVIGWQGSKTHDIDFKAALPALKRIIETYPNVILRFFGNVPGTVRGQIPSSRFEWKGGVKFVEYPATLKHASFDIGLAPLVDSKFNRAKSNLKWLEYAALRIPTVASRVGPYADSIEHGKNGFLASSPQEWYAALKRLIENEELRRSVGEAAHNEAWTNWSWSKRAPVWAEVLTKVCQTQQAPTLIF